MKPWQTVTIVARDSRTKAKMFVQENPGPVISIDDDISHQKDPNMLATIQRILFPTDFSEPAHNAQKYAMAFAEKFGAQLHLLHVVAPLPLPSTYAGQVSYLPDVDMTCLLESGKAQLAKEVDEDWFRNHPTVQAVELGFAADEIVRYVKHHKIDLIVMGTHGRTGLSHLVLGSVAEKIVRLSECPVLTVHPGTCQTACTKTEPTEKPH